MFQAKMRSCLFLAIPLLGQGLGRIARPSRSSPIPGMPVSRS